MVGYITVVHFNLSTADLDDKHWRKHTQHRNLEKWATRNPTKTGGEPRCLWRVSSSCFF